jgi:hypothetical protein
MTDVLAIFGPTDSDSPLLTEIERLQPTRVTVLIEGADPGSWGWAVGADSSRGGASTARSPRTSPSRPEPGVPRWRGGRLRTS